MKTPSRRDFLLFLGRTTAMASTLPVWSALLSACSTRIRPGESRAAGLPFDALLPSSTDELAVAHGFRYRRLITAGTLLGKNQGKFGTHNDFIAYLPIAGAQNPSNEGLLWVNHEYPDPLFLNRLLPGQKPNREQVLVQQEALGGSLIKIRKGPTGYEFVPNDPLNRRLNGRSSIPFSGGKILLRSKEAIGTFGNCGGGVTPWGTVLTCEENYDEFYGEAHYSAEGRELDFSSCKYGWESHFKYPPEHYGWVVEVNPWTGKAEKQIALGRFAHESATVVTLPDGRAVVYMGDDSIDECIYKFVAARPGSLAEGTLFVANTEEGRWIPLTVESDERLKKQFSTQTDLLVRCREAAKIVGGTPQHRPEDIEVDPLTGAVLISLTNHKGKEDRFGQILKIEEDNQDPSATAFKATTFMTGGPDSGFACPDNLAFDARGNLWIATDMGASDMNQGPYRTFGNNSLFYVPTQGKGAGNAFRVATAPTGAEFTGLCFSPDGKTLFVSVQHPGEGSKTLESPTSRWPNGTGGLPASAVVAIDGIAMDALVSNSGDH